MEGIGGHGNGHLEEVSLAWGPRGPAWVLMVPPAPPACSAHPHPRPGPHPHCAYPGGQALLAVQADSTLVGDLGEVFILKLLKADVVGEPGGSGDGAITHYTGSMLPVGREQHRPPRERVSRSLLGRKTGNGAPSRGDESVPTEWLGLAWSTAVGRQEECAPNQPLPDRRQQGHAGWESMGQTAQPAPSQEVWLPPSQKGSGVVPAGHRHPAGQRLGLQGEKGLGVLAGHSWRMDPLGQVTTSRLTDLASTTNPLAMARPAPEPQLGGVSQPRCLQ